MIVSKKFIDGLYSRELDEVLRDAHSMKISLRCSVDAAAMFSVIADRFGLTRFDLLEPFLNELAWDLFYSLDDKDRETISKEADKIATEILSKQDITITRTNYAGESVSGSDCWQRNNAKGSRAYSNIYSDIFEED